MQIRTAPRQIKKITMAGCPPSPPELWSLAWWDQIGPLIQAFMVLITGGIAIGGLTAWRRQMVGKRKSEIAEEVLINFYASRDVLRWARVAAFGAAEGESRKPDEAEPEQVRLM